MTNICLINVWNQRLTWTLFFKINYWSSRDWNFSLLCELGSYHKLFIAISRICSYYNDYLELLKFLLLYVLNSIKDSTFLTIVSSSITYNIFSSIANIQRTCYNYVTIHTTISVNKTAQLVVKIVKLAN